MSNWKKNIKWHIRCRVFLRDLFIKKIYNPIQVFRRKHGLADNDLFQHVLIQTNYSCTRRCSFCHYGHKNPPENIALAENIFYSAIDQLAAISYKSRLGLFEMNEPLTDKRFDSFLRYARKKLPKAWIFISSNGDLLTPEKAETLFSHGLNYIYLSSYDTDALARNRALLQNISSQSFNKIRHLNRSYQTAWTSRGGNIKEFKKNVIAGPCDLPCRVLYIKPTGKVHSCYNDFFDVNEMGDLKEEKILDIWFGEKFMTLRHNLHRGHRQYSQLCSQCDYTGYSNLPKIPFNWRIMRFLSE